MKRFTETEKWRDKWFRKLAPEYKLAWFYVCENCDNAGVIEMDDELANFQIGYDVNWEAFLDVCGGRIERLKNGKLWITQFVGFQCGELSEACKPHKHVIGLLSKHGILGRVIEGYPKGIERVPSTLQEKEKDLDKDKDLKKKKKECFNPKMIELPFDSSNFELTWLKWVDHRIELKKPLTPTSCKQQMATFQEWGERESIKAINHTIEKGWVGIRQPDGKTSNLTRDLGDML